MLSKSRSPVYASLEWLRDFHVITDADKATFEKAKELRNEIVHTFTSILLHGLPAGFAKQFGDMNALLDKVERWWTVNVDIATDPDFHGQEIDESQVIPGRPMVLRILLDIALGSEQESKKYMEEFIRQNSATEILDGKNSVDRPRKRHVSASARAKMAKAQRARRAKERAKKKNA